jgi:hypothetical protein
VGPAPKCRRSAFWEGPKKSLQSVLLLHFANLSLGGTEIKRGAQGEAEDRVPLGAGKPRSGDRA